MPLVWVTGNSGTGKSTVCEMLRARGHVALDADEDGFSQWIDRDTGEAVADPPDPVPEGWLDVRDLFDRVVCLVIDEDTLRRRLATRTTNAFGRHPEELAAALMWNPRMRAIYEDRGATIIEASQPVAEVVQQVIDAARG